jgi:hypothetical protein
MGKAETASRNKNVSGAADSGESRDGGTRAVSFSDLLLLGILFAACLGGVAAQPSVHRASYRTHGGALLNDISVTPGAVRTLDRKTICEGGSTKQFRNTTESMKNAAYAAYGVDKHEPLAIGPRPSTADAAKPLYEIDHLISLELGGADEEENLWPQPYYQHPGAHEKDAVENYLHKQICSGKLEPAEAQRAIATDWYQVYLDAHLGDGAKGSARAD